MKKLLYVVMLICFLLINSGFSDSEQYFKLSEKDVENFIAKYPKIVDDFDELDVRYNNENNEITVPAEVEASVNKILKKHGLNEKFMKITESIVATYVYLVSNEQVQTGKAEMAKALEEMKDNPNVPKELLEQAQGQYAQGTSEMDQAFQELKDKIPESNIPIITKYQDQLAPILEMGNMNNSEE